MARTRSWKLILSETHPPELYHMDGGWAERENLAGASSHRAKYGNKAVRAFLAEGWTVFPINPRATEIEELKVSSSLAAIDVPLDRITVYLPPPSTLAMLPEIAAAGADEVWFNPGSADERVLAAARDLGIRFRSACSIVDIGRSPSEFR